MLTFICFIHSAVLLYLLAQEWKRGKRERRRRKMLPLHSIRFHYAGGEVFSMVLKVSQKLPLAITLADKFGNPAQVDGAPQWSLTDPAKGTLVVAEDGMSAEFSPVGPMGSVGVQVAADADLGDGVRQILGELPVEIVAGDAAMISIAAGTPVDL